MNYFWKIISLETPLFMFKLLRLFDSLLMNWQSIIDVVERLCQCFVRSQMTSVKILTDNKTLHSHFKCLIYSYIASGQKHATYVACKKIWKKSSRKCMLHRGEWYFITKIVLTYCEKKIVLVIEKFFWNLRLKAENLQNFWDH